MTTRTLYRSAIVANGLNYELTKYSMNGAIRATETILRGLALQERQIYRGGTPTREGDIYTRTWTGDNGRVVTAYAHPWSVKP